MAPPPGIPVPSGWPASAELGKQVNSNITDGGHDEEDESGDMAAEYMFRQLGVKGITNLASYDNPMQKAAQKKLARARVPLAASGPNTLRAVTPLYGRHLAPSVKPEVKITPALLRAARTDPSVLTGVDMGKHGPDRADLMRNHPDLLSFPSFQRSESRQGETKQPATGSTSGYTTLATGPGAPRPLTAGPPGQRQLKAPNFETCIKRLQDGNGKPWGPIGQDIKCESDFNAAVSSGRPASTLPSRALSPLETRSLAAKDPIGGELVLHQSAYQFQESSSIRIQGVRDSLPVEAAARYFPNGFPTNYNSHNVEPMSSNWTERYPLHDRKDWCRTPDEIRRHNAKVNASFYNGNPLLGKTMDAASREAQRRDFDRQLGVNDEEGERALNRELELAQTFNISGGRRMVYPHLSIEEVNSQDTCEAAEPLLNMAFATLLSYQEDDGEKKTLSGWDIDPPPFYIDRSARARSSIFGDVPVRPRTLRPRTN
ncbi:hypothetical protein UCRPA7_5502 [Phaeoacremonium minimum UCRPA7]|uniref:Uncharacterized protein n=1 Tax=Phaeoacremonium minimum (strain UCR-PA7) TaxID=1286976 RepID=R8BIH0_PHAM7|nr:hypothetical protein UCRPA7_5502 [Phaeoacremonium minimum UCRPA7]EON99079.1 hypothetical protein UCRPA7_5502 [Phaeoacremonium minimum UCRPA7]